jgi:carboxylesterase type B
LTNNFLTELSCKASDSKCLAALSVQDILDATDNTFMAGLTGQLDPSIGGGEVFRPVRDGTLITSPLSTSATFPRQSKPILVTTVIDEATPTIFGFVDPQPIAPADYHATVRASYSDSSTSTLVNSSFYKLPGGLSANADVRPTVQVMGTDGIWRCPSWTFSRLWSASGAKAYVGQFVVGATHPDNAGISQCTASGAVCHEDDISIVFGTVSSPSAAQSKAIGEVQARWGAFIKTGNPNAPGYANWRPAGTGDNVGALQLGQNTPNTVSVGACTTAFWGKAVPYDYQTFGI